MACSLPRMVQSSSSAITVNAQCAVKSIDTTALKDEVARMRTPNAGAQPRGPQRSGSRLPNGSAARVGCSGLLDNPFCLYATAPCPSSSDRTARRCCRRRAGTCENDVRCAVDRDGLAGSDWTRLVKVVVWGLGRRGTARYWRSVNRCDAEVGDARVGGIVVAASRKYRDSHERSEPKQAHARHYAARNVGGKREQLPVRPPGSF